MQTTVSIPLWLRRSHPIVQRYLRQPLTRPFQGLLLALTIAAFLVLGGLSLPVLYFVFSLVILIQIATSSADKIYRARQGATWDLMRLAPYTPRELLLSLWAASLWQVNRTAIMVIYRLLHGMTIVGLMVFCLIFGEIPAGQALPVVVSGTVLIVLQPFAEMYFSGMVGLAGANRLRGQGNVQGVAVGVVMIYWLTCVAGVLTLLVVHQPHLTPDHLVLIFLLPVFLPTTLGYCALRVAESALR